MPNGLRSLTGVPVFIYFTFDIYNSSDADAIWQTMKTADQAGYLLAAIALYSNTDTIYNPCGIPKFHAYTLLSAFEMTESNGTTHKMFLMRNPWGITGYNSDWSYNDTRWTDALVA